MFTYNKETDVFWFNSNTFEDVQEFELIGMILGLAIYNNIILDIRFPNLIFKKLLDKPLSFEDFRDFDPALAKGFEQLMHFEGDVENTFCRSFTHTFDFFGEQKVVELKEGGADIPVTEENRQEYIELYVDYYMNKSIKKQYKTVHDGFHVVAGSKVRELFTWYELQLLICGSENVDFEALESSARYMDGFDKDSVTIKYFWEICHSLDDENKRKLLSFCTGSDRIPIRGLKDLVLTISKNGDDENHLPTSHTCYNHLLLPEYKNKDVMRERILTAIQNSEGFGLR
jgi:ubiquitin-protein ligase E3 A